MRFGLEENTINNIIAVFSGFPEVQEVILYGSRAKGNFKNGSDIDIVVKGDDVDLTVINNISLKLDDLYLPYTFDISVYSQIDNPGLLDHIDRVGIVLALPPVI